MRKTPHKPNHETGRLGRGENGKDGVANERTGIQNQYDATQIATLLSLPGQMIRKSCPWTVHLLAKMIARRKPIKTCRVIEPVNRENPACLRYRTEREIAGNDDPAEGSDRSSVNLRRLFVGAESNRNSHFAIGEIRELGEVRNLPCIHPRQDALSRTQRIRTNEDDPPTA